MSKSILLTLIVSLFLVHSIVVAAEELGTYPISPIEKVSPTEISIKETFASEFNILAFALGMYQLETEKGFSKEDIKAALSESNLSCGSAINMVFDLDNIDIRKKGFTRYYPFSANEKDFIIRIFDLREKHFLPEFEILHEGIFEDSDIGFQILPGLKTILRGKELNKFSLSDLSATECSL
ncbi:MAG: hypothetical protein ISS91_03395 [Candidatus Omnitrophica bacterium]|nr:hypothetical protein [Candidatus Omnitrophota bacterium]